MLNVNLVLRAGLIWGIIGIVLIVLVAFFGSSLPFAVEGLNLGTYAVLFAGVYFVFRNSGSVLVDLMGGALAGIPQHAREIRFLLRPHGQGFAFGNAPAGARER